METDHQRVFREDMLLYINAGLTATGQGGYYHGESAERLSLAFLHQYIGQNYRTFYTLCLSVGLNDHNLAHSVFCLLKMGSPESLDSRRIENRLIEKAVHSLPPQRAYRLFERLASEGVNNRRTRATVRSFLNQRKDLAFDAIKYRRRFRKTLMHFHLKVSPEVSRFLFEGAGEQPYQTELLETFRKAHYDERAIYELPYSVAQGLAAKKGIEPKAFLEKIEPRMTPREKLRLQRQGAGEVDIEGLDLVELCVYFLSCPPNKRPSLIEMLHSKASCQAGKIVLPRTYRKKRVTLILDKSRSSIGSWEARCRPLAVCLALRLVIPHLSKTTQILWSEGRAVSRMDSCEFEEELLNLAPSGNTNLGAPLLKGLESQPELVMVVSDGRENSPAGACEAIARVVSKRLPEICPKWLHLNPVYNPDDFSPKSLGPSWPVIGLRRVEDLSTALIFSDFTQGSSDARVLESSLSTRALTWLGDGP